MNRLQKKCFIAATGMHLLLLVILFVGPAFLSRSKPDESPVLTFVDLSKLSDNPTSGGGPIVPPPAAQSRMQTPAVAPIEKQTPPVKIVQPVSPKDEPKSVPNANQTKSIKTQVSLKLVNRNPNDSRTQDAASTKRQTDKINQAVRSLRDGLSSTTTIETPRGIGDGEANVNYAQAVQSIYESQWMRLDNAVADETIAKASITIASDGTVITTRITQSSGNAQVDALVQRTLDSVRTIAPFPPGAKETQRTYIINFNHKVKQLLG